MTAIGLLEARVGCCEIFCLEYRKGATAKQLGPAHASCAGDLIEPRDEVVIELNQDFTTSHDHMVEHMDQEPSPNVETQHCRRGRCRVSSP